MTRGENGTGAGVDNMSKLDFFSIDWYSQWFDDDCHDWKLEKEKLPAIFEGGNVNKWSECWKPKL